jgi:hypothetical protein
MIRDNQMIRKTLSTLTAAGVLALGFAALPTTTQPAQAASYTSCYVAMNGQTWCYRYACTAREEMAGCYEGWVRRNVWAA